MRSGGRCLDDEPFTSIDEEQGMLAVTPLRDGHVIIDVQEWDRQEPAEGSTVSESRFVMTRREFLRFMDWGKKRE